KGKSRWAVAEGAPHTNEVDVVAATVRHPSTIKGEYVSATIANLTKVLSEKIQDARKSTKRLAAIRKTE
ncbi:hypothetical protein MTO96_047348, partial [Rhipicephalus appendiculatus]